MGSLSSHHNIFITHSSFLRRKWTYHHLFLLFYHTHIYQTTSFTLILWFSILISLVADGKQFRILRN